MWRDAALVAGKDLAIEGRSRVASNQVLPFAVLVLVLFGFALDPDRGVLARASAGLFWLAVMFSVVLAVQRSMAVESSDAAADGLRLAGLDPAGVFVGKAAAVIAQLLVLEVVLGVGVVVLYGTDLDGLGLLVVTALVATVGLTAAGLVYAAIAAGLRSGDSLLPLLLLPVTAPVLIAGTRAFEDALDVTAVTDGWLWVRLLFVFATVYVAFGVLAFGALLEET